MKARILLTACALTGLASAATTVTENSTTQFTQGTWLNFDVNKFDSTLGTLTGVVVTVSNGNLQGSPVVTNTTTGTVTISACTDGLTVTGTAGLGYAEDSKYKSNVLTTDSWDSVSIAASSAKTLAINAGQTMAIAAQIIDPSFFSAYQSSGGAGQVTFKAQNVFSITTSGASYEVNASDVGVNTHFSVAYTYDVVPEPSTLLLGSLGALTLLRRRRR